MYLSAKERISIRKTTFSALPSQKEIKSCFGLFVIRNWFGERRLLILFFLFCSSSSCFFTYFVSFGLLVCLGIRRSRAIIRSNKFFSCDLFLVMSDDPFRFVR